MFITGHTGFKGAWLTQWLLHLGAEVVGFSDASTTAPSLYEQLGLESQMRSIVGDVRDLSSLVQEIDRFRPEYVFHLAAQALVRHSYKRPVDTFSVNAMGTLNVLEAIRVVGAPCVAVFVTTDKCYQNREWHYGYREDDALGGNDPYSASKAMAELAIASYRASFFEERSGEPASIRVASARAGNVIGGGDWAADRIIPDCVRALTTGQPIVVRNPLSTRPWQHVLDPLCGYLKLALTMSSAASPSAINEACSAFNFGPAMEAQRSVEELVKQLLRHWPGTFTRCAEELAPPESRLLALCVDKANSVLKWRGLWGFPAAVERTVEWYRRVHLGESPVDVTLVQIQRYESDLTAQSSSNNL